jgi:hypothetical protein
VTLLTRRGGRQFQLPRMVADSDIRHNLEFLLELINIRAAGGTSTFLSVLDEGYARGTGSGYDDTDGIQRALDASLFVYFPVPPDKYNISDTLTFREGHTLFGAGAGAVILADLTAPVLQSEDTGTPINGLTISGITIDNTDKANAGSIGVDLTNVFDFDLRNVKVTNVELGVECDGSGIISGLVAEEFVTGASVSGGTVRFLGPRLRNNVLGGTGINASGGDGVIIITPEFDNLTTDIDDTVGNVLVLQRDGVVLLPEGLDTNPIITFLVENTLGLYRADTNTLGIAGHAQFDGDIIQIAGQKLGLFGAAEVVQQSKPVMAAYTGDDQSAGYIDAPAALGDAATRADMNTLRAAYETLRLGFEDLRPRFQEALDRLELYGLFGP